MPRPRVTDAAQTGNHRQAPLAMQRSKRTVQPHNLHNRERYLAHIAFIALSFCYGSRQVSSGKALPR
jgi:hypothetical protein